MDNKCTGCTGKLCAPFMKWPGENIFICGECLLNIKHGLAEELAKSLASEQLGKKLSNMIAR